MATADAVENSHDHDDHAHGEFIAHHFTGPRQQYDSCKLGIWLFLVTEVLFFSGLFVAYTVYRYNHPEVFTVASEFLDTYLGALNTIVLLFSSLTMAWAVRAAQLEQHRVTSICVLITIFCAAMFLGVKAVEYSHKWHMGLYVAYFFHYNPVAHGGPDYLTMLSIIPGICVVVSAVIAAISAGTGKMLRATFWGGMALGLAGYFAGLGLGVGYEATFGSGAEGHAEAGHNAEAGGAIHVEEAHDPDVHAGAETSAIGAAEATETESIADEIAASGGTLTEAEAEAERVNQTRNIGLFFSIYYFMTGLHAFHIVAGILALGWILYRSIHRHFRADYFGPVDYVGLYWHLVDLIWIYLFPLLYLIG